MHLEKIEDYLKDQTKHLQNTNLHLDEKIVKTFMEDYTVNKFNYFIFFIKCILLYIINIIFYHPH